MGLMVCKHEFSLQIRTFPAVPNKKNYIWAPPPPTLGVVRSMALQWWSEHIMQFLTKNWLWTLPPTPINPQLSGLLSEVWLYCYDKIIPCNSQQRNLLTWHSTSNPLPMGVAVDSMILMWRSDHFMLSLAKTFKLITKPHLSAFMWPFHLAHNSVFCKTSQNIPTPVLSRVLVCCLG